jgi:2-polyprenyl-3-methyl-5-hydroxy-6-metoxy-1,4-benzoquinol methylase
MQATPKEFFDHEISIGVTPENPEYWNLMKATAEIIEQYDPKSVIEIGAGMGTLGECLSILKINYYGIEPNKYHRAFAKNRGQLLHGLNNYPNRCDLIVSIEVFEHLTDEQINDYLESIEANYLLLSSTPYTTTEEFDAWWGHINIKSTDQWIEFMAEYGYNLEKRLTIPTDWTLLFKK